MYICTIKERMYWSVSCQGCYFYSYVLHSCLSSLYFMHALSELMSLRFLLWMWRIYLSERWRIQWVWGEMPEVVYPIFSSATDLWTKTLIKKRFDLLSVRQCTAALFILQKSSINSSWHCLSFKTFFVGLLISQSYRWVHYLHQFLVKTSHFTFISMFPFH